MKLINKFILIYLTVTIVVLGIGGVFSFYIIKNEVDKELTWEFMERIDRVTDLMEQGREFQPENNMERDQNLIIRKLDYEVEPRVEVSDTLIWHHHLEQNEPNVKVSAYRNINGTSYYISTYGAMIETDDITEAVIKTLLWILGLQVLGAIGIGFFVSGRLFKPFRNTLERIGEFNLKERKPVEAEKTSVQEFDELNHFVEEMTSKVISDYRNLKEFAENASHELQTPLAIAKGKLELLAETDLSEEQFKYVESLERSVKKLSKLSESLALLTKIENHEFDSDQPVNMSRLIRESLESFDEFIGLNRLEVKTDIQDNVEVEMHPVLADILWTNLFQNAIRHNVDEGQIFIQLTGDKLKISNTGEDPGTDPMQLFERFRKADQTSESIGLGLSIIKRIVDQTGGSIGYTYADGWHRFEIDFG